MRRLMVLAVSIAVVLVGLGVQASVATSGPKSASREWKPTEIGEFWAEAINERGQIVGIDWSAEPVLWQKGVKRELQDPGRLYQRGETYGTDLHAINDSGQIVGSDVEHRYAFLWRKGKARILPPLAKGDDREASDINNHGQIVGSSGNRPIVWEKGTPRALPGGRGRARAINDRGVIVGVVGEQAVAWEMRKLRKLGTLGGSTSQAVDINERGQVVGWSKTKDEKAHGFLWQKGTMIDLGAGLWPNAINNRGQIVGSYRGHAFVWQSGKITDLGHLGGVLFHSTATGINERQQIVGTGWMIGPDSGMEYDYAVLWTYKP